MAPVARGLSSDEAFLGGDDMSMEEELNEFVSKMDRFNAENCPKWLTPNSYHLGVVPGHNLDLMQISFDFRIDRTDLLLSKTPQVLKDPSKPDLSIVEAK